MCCYLLGDGLINTAVFVIMYIFNWGEPERAPNYQDCIARRVYVYVWYDRPYTEYLN